MDEMRKILAINTYIQRGMGQVLHNGDEVICVALDRTCTTVKDAEIPLTSDELDIMFLRMVDNLNHSRTSREVS